MPTYNFEIDGVAKNLQPSWRISETLNGRNIMTFDVISLDGSYRPVARKSVVLEEDSDILFAGNIQEMFESGLGGHGVTPINVRVGSVDYNALPDRKMVEVVIPAGTLKSGLLILVEYLSAYGVTLHASQVDGPSFAEDLVFELQPLTEVFNKLSIITGYTWNIDYNKVLRMEEPGTTAAPFSITASDGKIDGDITVTPSLANFANRIIGIFLEAARSAYAFLTMSGNFANTEQVVVGSKTYTFQTVLTNSDGNVLIGTTFAESLDNLVAAITLGAGSGTIYAAAMTINGSVTAYIHSSGNLVARALTAGASGNSISCSTTSVNGMWITEGGIETTTLQFGADESPTNQVVADGGADPEDVVEKVITLSDIRDQATAQAIVDGYLIRAMQEPDEIKFLTRQRGLHPGMSISITEPKRGLSGSYLITEVEIYPIGLLIYSSVTAVTGDVLVPSFKETYKEWSGSSSGGTVISGALTPATGRGKIIIPLQPVPTLWVQGTAGSWYPADGSSEGGMEILLDPTELGTGVGTIYVRLKASSGNVNARLYDVTNSRVAGTAGSVVSTTSFTTISFSVSFYRGVHRLELSPSVSGISGRVMGVGYLEC